jgi:hypothetical protein
VIVPTEVVYTVDVVIAGEAAAVPVVDEVMVALENDVGNGAVDEASDGEIMAVALDEAPDSEEEEAPIEDDVNEDAADETTIDDDEDEDEAADDTDEDDDGQAAATNGAQSPVIGAIGEPSGALTATTLDVQEAAWARWMFWLSWS